MNEAVTVSVARTPIGRAFRGAFNNVKSPTLAAHAIEHAVRRARIEPAEIDDVVLGTVLGAGTAGMNVARNAALAARLPYSVPAQTIDRQCDYWRVRRKDPGCVGRRSIHNAFAP